MADRLTDFIHKCMKHGGVEGSVSFVKPNGYSVLASTDTLTFDKVNAGKDEVVIEFIANQDTVDLNVLGRMLKDGATAIFVSDQTELPVDDDKDKGKEAPGQLSLLKGSGN